MSNIKGIREWQKEEGTERGQAKGGGHRKVRSRFYGDGKNESEK
jgi:hypothetical protein